MRWSKFYLLIFLLLVPKTGYGDQSLQIDENRRIFSSLTIASSLLIGSGVYGLTRVDISDSCTDPDSGSNKCGAKRNLTIAGFFFGPFFALPLYGAGIISMAGEHINELENGEKNRNKYRRRSLSVGIPLLTVGGIGASTLFTEIDSPSAVPLTIFGSYAMLGGTVFTALGTGQTRKAERTFWRAGALASISAGLFTAAGIMISNWEPSYVFMGTDRSQDKFRYLLPLPMLFGGLALLSGSALGLLSDRSAGVAASIQPTVSVRRGTAIGGIVIEF